MLYSWNKPTAADLVRRNMKSYLPPNKTLWILTIKCHCHKRHYAWRHLSRYNHRAAPSKHGIWVNIAYFLHNADANMLCWLLDDCKYMYIYLPIHQVYYYLGKQKYCWYFPESACEHLWPSLCKVIAIPCGQLRMCITSF